MDKLIYSSLSGMRTAMARQTVTANNLANINTAGFRGEMSSSSALWLKGNGFVTRAPNSGEVLSADMSEGVISETGRPLDVAVQGKDAYLAVQSREGDEAYTRRGDLQVSDSGLLTTGDGSPVMGDTGPITLPPYDKLTIGSDGTISIIPLGGDPTQSQMVDRLKLVSTNGVPIAKGLDGLFRVRSGGSLASDPQATVRQGAIEGSNVNASAALIDMIEASRDFQRPALPEATLDSLPPALRQAVTRAGWSELMPVQARTIPYLLAGRDVMIQARTGSGKTGAFLLPMLERLYPGRAETQALILVPTRELAVQVARDAETLCAAAGLRTVALYGGVGYGGQLDALQQGAHIVVGTPGRVLDHLLKRTLSLERLEMLVFDEADRMMSMGFYPDMRQVQRYLPKRRLHASMFSATFPAYVMATAREFIRDPEFISLSKDHVHVTDTEHIFYRVPGLDKDRALVRIIELENPASALIFCNTKSRVHYVNVVLQRFGYDADELSADLSQADRERVLGRVRAGTLKFLVATDVAGRGIDLPELSHVFQYELPDDIESYIHRAGRTGRRAGVAISLISGMEHFALDRIAKSYKIELQERPLPSDADVAVVVGERLTALLEARLRERDKLQTERSQRFVPLARSLAESEDEQAVIAMLLDDYYQQLLHAPAVVPGTTISPAEKRAEEPRRDAGSGEGRRRSPRRR